MVVDSLSKYRYFMGLCHLYTRWQRLLLKRWLSGSAPWVSAAHCLILRSHFVSDFRSELFRNSGTKSFMNLANHPDMNGQIKVLNRNLHAESYIGTFEALV